MDTDNKIALITGSSRGIGREIARLFAKNRVIPIIHYHHSKKEAEKTLKIVEALGVTGRLVRADLKDRQQISSMVKEAISLFGCIDILVNNAGIRQDNLMLQMRDDMWQEVITTNLSSVFYCSKMIGRQMVKQKKGVIVNISSLSGVCGRIAQANYSASKAGVIGLTKSMALELARWRIRVNAIVPGLIATDMTQDLNPKMIKDLNIPLGRAGKPEEVAQCALFLASDMSSYITGTTVAVNGGLYT